MKHLAIVTLAILFSASISAQSLSVTCLRSSFIGGYNITCHGATDGTINSIVTGGQPPFIYTWSNGATSQNLNSLPAGEYILTVTDSLNATVVDTVELIEPDQLTVELWTWEDGYGDYFGFIGLSFTGGTISSLDILWSTGENYYYLNDAALGLHWITITDANGCVASDTISMNPMPNAVKITNVSQHNISCHGGNDGSIDLTISNGLEPFTYQWSNGNFTQNIDTLPAGTYDVIVTDWYQTKDTAHITLTQPIANSIQFSTSTYPNGYNTSCATCTDASIEASDTGGVSPKTYLWSDGKTGAVNNSLGKGIYSVIVTDGNGCTASQSIQLTGELEAWKIGGNTGIDTTQFMGTTDHKDLVIKTDNAERITVKADGTIDVKSSLKISPSLVDNYNSVYVDNTGVLKVKPGPGNGCDVAIPDIWYYNSCNSTADVFLRSPFTRVGIGTIAPLQNVHLNGSLLIDGSPSGNQSSLYFGSKTSGANAQGEWGVKYLDDNTFTFNQRGLNFWRPAQSGHAALNYGLFINNLGEVGIGVDISANHDVLNDDNGAYKLSVNGGIRASKVKVYAGWADYVFKSNYSLQPIDSLDKFIHIYKHLPGIPSESEVQKSGIDLGETSSILLAKIEELTLYMISIKHDNDELKHQIHELKNKLENNH